MNNFCNTIGIVFLIANFYTILTVDNSNKKKKFVDLLSDHQKEIYDQIILERQMIYIGSYIIGFIISYCITTNLNSNLSRVCSSSSITFVIVYLIYTLYPKSDYMILHLNDKNKRKAWLDLYIYMQKKYHYGLLFGILTVIILSIK
uniref:Uncharacterized protein n=1 Tax=Megaviridae environmental sample TaxID=1737588 RepID=A0A5J6VLA5_9VIRU|nr:MAG: hypothetical protein [Megaviridae environmental sample]